LTPRSSAPIPTSALLDRRAELFDDVGGRCTAQASTRTPPHRLEHSTWVPGRDRRSGVAILCRPSWARQINQARWWPLVRSLANESARDYLAYPDDRASCPAVVLSATRWLAEFEAGLTKGKGSAPITAASMRFFVHT